MTNETPPQMAQSIDRQSELYRCLVEPGMIWSEKTMAEARSLGILFDGASLSLFGLGVRDALRGDTL